MTRLLLLRHGQSTWNAEARWQGWADPPLSELGEVQAEQAAGHLRALELTAVASSDLVRARRTAEILAEACGLGPVVVHRGLRERNVGAWSGLTFEEIDAGWPGLLALYRSGSYTRPPGGEDSESLVARTAAALGEVAEQLRGESVLTISHGGVIRSLERSLGVEPMRGGLPNLGGRWFSWTAEGLRPHEPVMPLDPDMVTAPPAR